MYLIIISTMSINFRNLEKVFGYCYLFTHLQILKYMAEYIPYLKKNKFGFPMYGIYTLFVIIFFFELLILI